MDSVKISILDFLEKLPPEISFLQPEIILVGIFLLLLTISIPLKSGGWVVATALVPAFLWATYSYSIDFQSFGSPIYLFSHLLIVDRMGLFFKIIFTVSGALALLIYFQQNENTSIAYPLLILAIVIGLDILVMANHWAISFLSLETVSLSSYLIVCIDKQVERAEAGIKYLLFGAASSALMLYGITWLYGTTHSLLLSAPSPSTTFQGFVFLLIISGLLFKISAFPFHFWTPDVYQGTPGYLLPFLSYAPKIGAFVILIRYTQASVLLPDNYVLPILAISSIGSLLIGNWGALRQDHSLRLLSYSGIAQTGFILAGVGTGMSGIGSTVYYLAVYLFMNFSVFYVLYIIGKKKGSFSIKGLQGLGSSNPILGLFLLVGLISLAGLPPTVGFSGKLLIFSSLWNIYTQSGNVIFLLLLLSSGLFTLTSFYFYFKIPYYAFVKRNETNFDINLLVSEKLLVLVLALPLIILFFVPQILNNFVKMINLVY